jgi:ferredoxin
MKRSRTAAAVFASIAFLLTLAAFAGVPFTGWIASLQAVPAALKACVSPVSWIDALPLAAILVLTLLFGRFYCKVLCPLGVAQSFANWLFRGGAAPRRVCTRLPNTRTQTAVKLVFLLLFLVLPFWVLDPYAIFGRAVSLFMPVGVLGFAIILSAVFGSGRFWCNWVCPVGTVLGLLARFSMFKDKVGYGCADCRRCFPSARPAEGGSAGEAVSTRRGALKGVAALAVADKLTDGGFAPVSLPGSPARPAQIMPPGAGKRSDFETRCVSCQLCAVNCPEHAIVPSTDLRDFGRPRLDFRRGYCRLACTKCGEVCPSGAISKLQPQMREHVHMGHAIWKKDRCLRATVKEECIACVRKCPLQAIHLVKGFPVVDKGACVGCGACEHVCPARPMPAIFVKGFDEQRTVLPMGESDLIAEMRSLVEGGFAVVLARDGRISEKERGSGIAPLMKLLDAGRLDGAIVFDKVFGRAAAAIAIVGKVRRVNALVMSEGAKELLEGHSVPAAGVKMTPSIRNRRDTGICPMDKAVEKISDPVKMVEELRKVMKK